MGCDNCFNSPKGQQQQLENVIREAKKYAVEKGETMAIYKEGEEYSITTAGSAIAAGFPVIQFISFNS